MTVLSDFELVEYVPQWPSYSAQRLERVVITNGRRTFDVGGEGIAVYRLRTRLGDREAVLLVPVPDDLAEPLANPYVMSMIEQAGQQLP